MRAVEDHYWWFVSRRRLARLLLRQHGKLTGRLLDLGAGTGALLSELQPDYEAFGLDCAEESLKFCRQRGLNRLVLAFGEDLPFAGCSFDAIVALDTLEHIGPDSQALQAIRMALKPGGIVVINVPAYRWLWGPHDVALHHHRRYTRREIRNKAETAGLQVERISYSVFLLFPVVVLIRLIDKFRRKDAKVRLPEVSGPFNRFLVGLQDFESRMMLIGGLPWGSSVVAVLRRPADSQVD